MNKENYRGLTKKEHTELLKECGMCTKKWTLAKIKQFEERRLEILHKRNKNTGLKKMFRIFKKLRGRK